MLKINLDIHHMLDIFPVSHIGSVSLCLWIRLWSKLHHSIWKTWRIWVLHLVWLCITLQFSQTLSNEPWFYFSSGTSELLHLEQHGNIYAKYSKYWGKKWILHYFSLTLSFLILKDTRWFDTVLSFYLLLQNTLYENWSVLQCKSSSLMSRKSRSVCDNK